MKNFMLKKVFPVLITVILVAVVFLTVGAGFTQVVGLAFNTVIIAMIYALVSDAEGRFEFDKGKKKSDKKLVNWQYWIGLALMFAAIYFLTRFTVLKGVKVWIDGGVSAVLFALAAFWFSKWYKPSIMGSEAFFEYNMQRYAPKYERAVEAGDRVAGVHELGRILYTYCVNDSLAKGPDTARPFDADGRRYVDLAHSRDKHDNEVAESVIYPYLGLVFDNDVKNGFNYKESK